MNRKQHRVLLSALKSGGFTMKLSIFAPSAPSTAIFSRGRKLDIDLEDRIIEVREWHTRAALDVALLSPLAWIRSVRCRSSPCHPA